MKHMAPKPASESGKMDSNHFVHPSTLYYINILKYSILAGPLLIALT